MIARCLLSLLLFTTACARPASPPAVFVEILGVAQDAGSPQLGAKSRPRELVASLLIVDQSKRQRWLVDATPDIREQLRVPAGEEPPKPFLDGVLLTHAHVGHYSGLIHFGREAMNAQALAVFASDRMAGFLEQNGPWSLLVALQNLRLIRLAPGAPVALSENVRVVPFVVPHRDEFSDTLGFVIKGPQRAVAYIPDIDKWQRWSQPLASVIQDCDVTLVDGTFFDGNELPGRSMAEIPHPFVVETLELLETLPKDLRSRLGFIHLNHTNPLLDPGSPQRRQVEQWGAFVASRGQRIALDAS